MVGMTATIQSGIDLKADPYSIFEKSDSPIAMHARKRWASKGGEADSKKITAVIRSSQSANGSWNNSVAQTIENLFALFLLVRPSPATAKAIDWLLEVDQPPMQHPCYSNLFFRVRRADVELLKTGPFSPGCSGFVKTGGALFLASLFNQGDDRRVSQAFATLAKLPAQRQGRFCSASCSNNILQAFAANDEYRSSAAMKLAVARLEQEQMPNGNWSSGFPFYPTFYALSRIESKSADAQFRRALPRIVRVQKKDGSWGHSPLNTFLVLDALERKGMSAF
jgi:hypothetical protein